MSDITNKFDHRIKNPEPHIVGLLGEIDGIRGEFKSGLRMTPQAITSLKRSVLITSAGASTRIEGANTSRKRIWSVYSYPMERLLLRSYSILHRHGQLQQK